MMPLKKPPSAGYQECSRGIAALLADLKERGMLDDTLVLWENSAAPDGRTNQQG